MPDNLKISTITKMVRYFLTAGTAAIFDLGGFAILIMWGIPIFWSAVLSFITANVVNYLLSSKFAFGRIPTFQHYPLFLAASTFGLFINTAITILLTFEFQIDPIASKLTGIAAAFLINFGLNLRVVFVR